MPLPLRATIIKCHSPTGAAPHVYKDPEDERQRHRNTWFDRLDAIVELATCATDVVFTFVVLWNSWKKALDTAGKTAVYAGLFYASVSVLSLQLFLRLVMALYPLTFYDKGEYISWKTYGQGVLTTLVDPLYGIKLINKANLGQLIDIGDKIKGEVQLQYSLLFAGILLLILEDIPELGTCTAPIRASHRLYLTGPVAPQCPHAATRTSHIHAMQHHRGTTYALVHCGAVRGGYSLLVGADRWSLTSLLVLPPHGVVCARMHTCACPPSLALQPSTWHSSSKKAGLPKWTATSSFCL